MVESIKTEPNVLDGFIAGYKPAPLENWYRENYFTNDIDISGSGVEEYSYEEIKNIADFDFHELDNLKIKDGATVGSIEIRQLIAERFGYGHPEKVMITNGSNEALQLAVRSILLPGDELVTHSPCYHCHDKIAESMGCTVKKWKLNLDHGATQDVDNLRELITEKTKALILNFPNNPTGISISQSMLNEIVEIARENGVFLIWDAAFQELTYESAPLVDPIQYYENAISVGTFSKAYGAPGLRFGWLAAPSSIINACVRQKDYGNLFVAPLVEFIATKMFKRIDEFSTPRLKQATNNLTIVNDWSYQHGMSALWRQPDGGVCGLLKLPGLLDDASFCDELLESHGVLLVPGGCFDVSGNVRLGFGGDTRELTEGLTRLGDFIDNKVALR